LRFNFIVRQGQAIAANQFNGLTTVTLPRPCRAGRRGARSGTLALASRHGSSNREVSRESSLDGFGRWRCALQRHVGAGIGDAHQQPRRRGERSRAEPKRALRVQSVSLPVAAELRLSPAGLLRLWTKLLQLRTKLLQLRTELLCTKLLWLRRLVRRLVWRRSVGRVGVVGRAIVCSRLRLGRSARPRLGPDVPASANRARAQS